MLFSVTRGIGDEVGGDDDDAPRQRGLALLDFGQQSGAGKRLVGAVRARTAHRRDRRRRGRPPSAPPCRRAPPAPSPRPARRRAAWAWSKACAAWRAEPAGQAISSPVSEAALQKRQRGDGGGVGAKDARPQAEPQDVGQAQQRRALGLVEAAFGADQQADAARGPGLPAARRADWLRPRPRRRTPKGDLAAMRRAPLRAIAARRSREARSRRIVRRLRGALASSLSRLSRATWVRRVSTGRSERAPISTAFCAM